MNKTEFLKRLRKSLSGVPKEEKQERLSFYEEMIEDYIEEGFTEEQAVSKIGTVENIAYQIKSEEKAKKQKGKKEPSAWKKAFLIAGSPIWFSLIISAFAVVISLYASLFTVVISLWLAFGMLIVGGVGSIIFFVTVSETVLSYIAIVGAGIFAVGFAIFIYYALKPLTRLCVALPKKTIIIIKNSFAKRRGV